MRLIGSDGVTPTGGSHVRIRKTFFRQGCQEDSAAIFCSFHNFELTSVEQQLRNHWASSPSRAGLRTATAAALVTSTAPSPSEVKCTASSSPVSLCKVM
ncbi:Protein of unknown function [Gryllus bimaculatus]|nr:Protein of unknown function [Gryllus bimaculatus]